MGILDDSAIFTAVIQQGGFSHAAKYLGISNGLVSRRITQLEATLGVSLIKRTTRELRLTPEGELFLQYTLRIQQEMDSALSLIQSSTNKPSGRIRVSAPPYFGRSYLTPLIMKFLVDFPQIKIDLVHSNRILDPIKEELDLALVGAGFIDESRLQDSSMQMKLLMKEKIGLYASSSYLNIHEKPNCSADLLNHPLIHYSLQHKLKEQEKWRYFENGEPQEINFEPAFNANDIESCMNACIAGLGIGRFTELDILNALGQKKVYPLLEQYDWGTYYLYALYPQQHVLPERTRVFLDFIFTHTKTLLAKAKHLQKEPDPI